MALITETHFQFPSQIDFYRGKVRDVYIFSQQLVMVATDRISAFDVILPQAIPYKGQVLNQLSAFFLKATASKVPNWLLGQPDPNVSIGRKCQPLAVEMVIRAYLAGSAWRAYQKGQRDFNGQILPDGLRENDPLPAPILTPSTKAEKGTHDEDIRTEEIIARGLATPAQYEQMAAYTRELFEEGRRIAAQNGLILADTKYEFGLWEGAIYLMDEIHTPDSSRYFDTEGFAERQENGERQPHRSKEMVRQWLIAHHFMGQPGETIPTLSPEWIEAISQEYIALYEQITGQAFIKPASENRLATMEMAIAGFLAEQPA
ncbi:MAG: phosphoribosylaminoimidazolesuccinocarboxamide synthase [Microscillaceae bacterium]